MFRTFLLILFLCGLTLFSVVLEYRARAETFACQPVRVCRVPTAPPCAEPACPSPLGKSD